ncbi:MAG: hypothetical protein AB2L18_12685 [Anaerolineaceae bacterium]
MQQFSVSASGVKITEDFRSNLIIDRYDPIFAHMRAKKLKLMRSENSEDVVTWNIFRSLRQIDPNIWIPKLQDEADISSLTLPVERVTVELWQKVSPPPALLLTGDEGDSEIDIVLEAPFWVWFIEAKFKSDISERTTTRTDRDQVIRNIDVGSYYAGNRSFLFSLLILDEKTSPKGVNAIQQYQNNKEIQSRLSQHRPDKLSNVKYVGTLTWAAMGRVIEHGKNTAVHNNEKVIATCAFEWLRNKVLIDNHNC